MQLTDVKGVGRSAARKLEAAGIGTVQELAEIDQRTVKVPGLGAENVARLRRNAQALLGAVETDDLMLVEGVGESVAEKLHAAGVESIQDLLELDLRFTDVDGLSVENLQRLRNNATYLVPGAKPT